MIRRIFALFILLLLLPGVAQAQEDGTLYLEADGGSVEAGAIITAAQPLIDRGAMVVVHLVDDGSTEVLDQRLMELGLMENGLVDDALIAIFVSIGARDYEIRYGDNWVNALQSRSEGIGSGSLGPNLREGEYTLAFARTLEAIEAAIANVGTASSSTTTSGGLQPAPQNPGYTPYRPPSSYTPESDSGGGIGTIILIVIIAGGVFVMWLFNPEMFENTGNYSGGAPRYKSNWSSGSSSSRSSSRSSFSSSSRSSSRSFGSGGRSKGKW